MNILHWNEGDLAWSGHKRHKTLPIIWDTPWTRADMILGDAKSNCRGAGICKISVQSEVPTQACGCPTVPIILSKVDARCLQLIVDKQAISLPLFRQHFAGYQAKVSTALRLSKPLAKCLQITETVYVKPSFYTVYHNEQYFHFMLDLTT